MVFIDWVKCLTHRDYKRALGYLTITATIIATLAIWFFTLSSTTFIQRDPFLFASKISIFIGTLSMCWTFLLATRIALFNDLFGGLDKAYHVHKNMGRLSYACVVLHILFQCMRHIPNGTAILLLFIPKELGGLEFGIAAFALFTLLLALTLWISIPYHIWKRTHELFIFVLVLSFLHIYYINKHVNASRLLSIWLYGWILLAFAAYIFIRFAYYYVGPRYTYSIESIVSLRDLSAASGKQTWNISLAADPKKMEYQPGQFVYVQFKSKAVTPEIHPYSISSYPAQENIRLSIKSLGDHTQTLEALHHGETAIMWGPYGKLYEAYLFQNNVDAVMFAGGIGITPFLSMLGHEAHNPHNRKTYIFYCVKDPSRADFEQELRRYAALNPNIHYISYCTTSQGYISTEKAKEFLGSLKHKNYFLCGPKPMMNSLICQLKKNGIRNCSIHYEDFNFIE